MRVLHAPPVRSALVAALLLFFLVASALGAPRATSGTFHFTLLQTTDLHHHANGADHVGLDVDPVNATSPIGAYARIAAYVNHVRYTAGHPVVLVDSGDWTMGTAYDLTLGSQPLALRFLDLMRYDCTTLGNHEFDYGPAGLARMLSSAQSAFGFHTPIVASNMSLNGNADLAPFFGAGKAIQPVRVQELDNGLKLGFIGLMGRQAALDAPASAPVSFADPGAQYAALQALVNSLRKRQGVAVVIALSHAGTDPTGTSGEDVELARHVSGIDVIASGHTHTPLAGARLVANGSWTTAIVDAGAYGTNVTRLDLTYHRPTKRVTVDALSNPSMTDDGLAALGVGRDATMTALVHATDLQLNAALGGVFAQVFPDYDAGQLGKGLYHPVGAAAQDMVYNAADPVPAPNGLGDLAADGVRAVPNAIVAQTLAAVGGNPANLPGYDFTPYQVSVVASGVLRAKLRAGVPISFADVYDVLPLGITPDLTQALPVGYPLISAYLELDDLKKICALQLVVQSGLGSADLYVNLSGLRYTLNTAASFAYFKSATAAAVLRVTSDKAGGGSALAQQALQALASLGSDGGAALLAAAAAGNPYAAAMVKLNEAAPSAANLLALGEVAAAAAAGGNTLPGLIVGKAIAAIDSVEGFAPADTANVGATAPLPSGARVRVAADLYAILSLGAVQAQFGTAITVYKAGTGTATLGISDMASVLQNRIDAAPATAGVQELKEWMTLLSYLGGGLGGFVGPAYFSTGDFTQFPAFGTAVTTRSASYPLPGIGQMIGTVASLKAAP